MFLHRRSTNAVLPEPTGPPTPTLNTPRDVPMPVSPLSDRQMLLHDLVGERINGTGYYQSSLVEEAQLGGNTPREGQLLLHQQHGESLLPVQPRDHIADLAHDVRLDAFGGLIEHQQRRIGNQRTTNGQLLLLPAGKIATAP